MENNVLGNVFSDTLKNWVNDFDTHKEMGVDNWLSKKLGEAFSDKNVSEVENIKIEIFENIEKYERNKEEIQQAYEQGQSKEEWLAEKLETSTEELDKSEQMEVLGTVHNGLLDALGEIDSSQSVEVEETAELESKRVANSVGEIATVRIMQVLGEEDEDESAKVEPSEFIEESLKNHSEIALKKMASGALVSLVKKGRIPLIPPTTPVGIITHIACFGIDHAKTIVQMARKEISLTEGLRRITQGAVSTIFGMLSDAKGKIGKGGLSGLMSAFQKPLSYVSKVSNSVLKFIGGEELKTKVQEVKKRLVPVAQNFVREFVSTAASKVRSIASRIKSFLFG